MKIRGVDFVMYPVSNLTRAARFYREVLGLRQEIFSREGQWAEFNCGNVTLSLHGGEKIPKRTAGPRLALAVKDLPAAQAELKRKKVRVLQPLQDYSVCQAMVIADPDGNAVILHQRADGTCGQQSRKA